MTEPSPSRPVLSHHFEDLGETERHSRILWCALCGCVRLVAPDGGMDLRLVAGVSPPQSEEELGCVRLPEGPTVVSHYVPDVPEDATVPRATNPDLACREAALRRDADALVDEMVTRLVALCRRHGVSEYTVNTRLQVRPEDVTDAAEAAATSPEHEDEDEADDSCKHIADAERIGHYALCGAWEIGFMFRDVAHWFEEVRHHGRLTGCPACVAVVRKACDEQP